MPLPSKPHFWSTDISIWFNQLKSSMYGLTSEQVHLLESKKTTKHIVP
jgi:hypothetical protein